MFIKWSGQGTGPAEVMLPGMIKVCNDFYHPASMRAVEDLEEGQHQFCLQVGSAFPEYPIRDSSATYCQLRRTVGHPIHIYIYIYIYIYIFEMLVYCQIRYWYGYGKDFRSGLYWSKH